jgi:hypothetical protein
MRNWMKLGAFAGAALLLAAAPALSAGAATSEEFARRLLGREPARGATYACFNRLYDAAHLASHPQQNVRSMLALVVYTVDPKAADQPPQYDLRIGVVFRKRTHMVQAEGDCRALKPENDPNGPVTAHCSVACDGGSIDVALKDNGSLLVTLPDGARVWTSDESDKQGEADLKGLHGGFGADDKLFRVDRADIKQCLELGADAEEKANMTRAH